MKKLALILTAILALTACGSYKAYWEDRPGDIVTGYPATVVNNWSQHHQHIKYYGPRVWVLYVVTQKSGCSECDWEQKTVTPSVYRNLQEGERVIWEDDDYESTVVQHRYRRDSYYTNGYIFALEVKQCRPGLDCVTDFVSVDLHTWSKYSAGDQIMFSGVGDVVSD